MNRKTFTLAAAVAAAALTLSACGTASYVEDVADAPESAAAEQPDTDTQDGADSAAETDVQPADAAIEETESPLLAFGDAATYADGLVVAADVVDTVAMSEVASSTACVTGDPVTVVELTVTNGTDGRIMPWEDFMGSLNAEYVDSSGYAVAADGVFDAPGYGHEYDLSGGQNFATLRPGQTGSDLYGFCTVDMEAGSLYLSIDPTTYDEPGYKDLAEWTEDGQW